MTNDSIIKKKKLARDIIIVVFSVILAIYIQRLAGVDSLLSFFTNIYYVIPAAFLTGVLFSFTFTVAIATSVFIILGDTSINPFLIAIVGGLGAVFGNSLTYKFFKNDIIKDLKALEPKYAKEITRRIFKSKLFIWILPYVAALLLASPLPDEIGIFLLAGSRLRYANFFLLSFFSQTTGILVIVLLGELFA